MDHLDTLRTLIDRLSHRLEHVLPAQAPIRDFVHHNTLHGFQKMSFRDALGAAEAATGAHGFLPVTRFHTLFREGRINTDDLAAALDETPELRAAEPAGASLSRREVLMTALRIDLSVPTAAGWRWQVEEHGVLERVDPEVPAAIRDGLFGRMDTATSLRRLWEACTARLTPVGPQAAASPGSANAMRKDAEDRCVHLLGSVGAHLTLGGLLRRLTGRNVLDPIRPYLIRHLAAHLDLGLVAWPNPARGRGFYAAWLASARDDPHFELHGLVTWTQTLERLPEDPLEAILQTLRASGLEPARWEDYLETLAKALPGWSGMVLWRDRHPGRGAPVTLADYLAVHLVLEQLHVQQLCAAHFKIEASLPGLRGYLRRHAAELLVRLALYGDELPEWLADEAHRLVRAATGRTGEEQDADWLPVARLLTAWRRGEAPIAANNSACPDRHAWPLFRLCQHLGIDADALAVMTSDDVRSLLGCVAELTPERAAWVWLQAYERHYREQVFGALAANHGRGAWRERAGPPPRAQLVFCMDDREEGLRRHIEECAPDVETLGAAAHLGLFIRYHGFGEPTHTDFCPVGARPAHLVEETAAPGAEAAGNTHLARRSRRLAWKARFVQGSRRDPAQGLFATLIGAPAALALLAGRMLAPAALARRTAALREAADGRIATRLRYTALADTPATPDAPRAGYTEAEQAERVQAFLTAIGLTRGFAPLVAVVGHGSNSLNNPHMSAYDCGACSGRHSGTNARLFAAMANDPVVRERVRARGIDIPVGTWFIGAEHNTCDDQFTWYDTTLVPQSHATALAGLRTILAEASARHAQERCRRFLSAPLDITQAQALRHVAARPELGHVNNAAAFIGRRAATRGAFFDRRIFLISYDCGADPDGRVLEPMLVANGLVGAGISLEYYFSTVDNARYGSGSKVTHNIAGLFGVMDGTSSDLRTGLPAQMIEIHEPMRLLVVVEHTPDVLSAIYARQPVLQELVGHGWLQLAVKDPDSPAIQRFVPGSGWLPWQGDDTPLPTVRSSVAWTRGHRDALPPALIDVSMEAVP